MENLNSEQQQGIQLRDYLVIFFQNKWTVISIFLVAFLVAIFLCNICTRYLYF